MTDAVASTSAALDGNAAVAADTTPAAVTIAADAALGKPAANAATIAWLEGASAEQVGYVQNKGWTDPKQLLDGYQNLEKLRGVPADRLLTLPAADADQAARDAFYDKLGRPKAATDYGFKFEDATIDTAVKGLMHKHGFSADQAAGFVADFQAFDKTVAEDQKKASLEKFQADNQALRTEWGAAYEQNHQIAKQGRDALGWSNELIDAVGDAIGHGQLMKMLHNVGSRTGEATFVGSGQQPGAASGALTPAQAQARLSELTSDKEWVKRLMSGGTESKEAQERRRLIGFVTGGQK